MTIFFNFSTTSSHLHPLQVENCGSNSRLLVDENDNGKFRPERVKYFIFHPLEVVSRFRDPHLQVGENCFVLFEAEHLQIFTFEHQFHSE